MGGSVHFHKPARRYYVSLYWDGKPNKIWRYNGEPIWHEKTAQKLLNKIRAEIDSGVFNLKSYFPDSPLSLKVYAETWLRASTVSPATIKFYKKAMIRVIAYFGKDYDIRTFTNSKLKIFYNELPLSVKGKYNILSTLKTMLNSAYKDELIKKVPPFPKLPLGLPQEIKYLNIQQQNAVLEQIPKSRRPIFEFAMEYGLRLGEVMGLQKDCITKDEIIIKRAVSDGELRESTKTGRIRRYGITKNAKRILESIPLHISPFLFVRENGLPYTRKVLTKTWASACRKAGIKINLYNAVRHSLGCQLLDSGVDLEMVRDVLGHTSTNMTRRYAQRAPQKITAVLEFREGLNKTYEKMEGE